MTGSPTNKNLALEMARCPNCGYAVDQLGNRKNCGKCGKRLTVECIFCKANNPPAFQHCLKCGSDFRLLAVEQYGKQLAKLDFEIAQYDRLASVKMKAASIEEILKIAGFVFTISIGIFCLIVKPEGLMIASLLFLSLIGLAGVRFLGCRLSLLAAGMAKSVYDDWGKLTLTAKRLKGERLEVMEKLGYFQQELKDFRKSHQSGHTFE